MTKLRLLYLLTALLCLANAAWAQSPQLVQYSGYVAPAGYPFGPATIAVCVVGGSGGPPCSPLTIIYTDNSGTRQQPNPFTIDPQGNGNFHFFAACGTQYALQSYGNGYTTTLTTITTSVCTGGGGGGNPVGPAGGDLNGSYPGPGVVKVNGGLIPTSKALIGTNSSGQLVDATPPASKALVGTNASSQIIDATPPASKTIIGTNSSSQLIDASTATLSNPLSVVHNPASVTITGTTPSVSGGNSFVTGNGSATTITNFTGGVDSQTISVNCGDAFTTIANNANISTFSNSNIGCVVNQAYSFTFYSSLSKWVQVGGGGGTPGGVSVQAQFNNSNTFAGSGCVNLPSVASTSVNFDCDTHPAGTNPKVDITRYGARAVQSNAQPSTTGACSNSSNQVTVGTVTNPFQVGDYIITHCGAAPSPATPAAPTVTSGASTMQTVYDAKMVAYTAANTDSYLLVTRDNNGGITLPGPATTITTAVPLGQQTATVSSVSSLGTTMTITLGSTGPPNGTLFHLSYVAQGGSQPSHKFDGYYNICSGGGTTSITVCNMPFWSNTTDSTAAEIIWFNGNQLTWSNQANAYQQMICGKRVGDSAYHFLGASLPPGNTLSPLNVWTDWGTTLTPSTPTGFTGGTDAICTAASTTLDYFSAKITACTASCGTGSTWTLSATPPSTVAVAGFTQESGPALAAAMAFANANFTHAAVYIPCAPAGGTPGFQFFFYTPIYLTSNAANWVEQCGPVEVFETIDLNGNPSVSWIGSAPSEAGASPVNLYCNCYPCLNDANLVRNITFNAGGNDGSLAIVQNAGAGNSTIAMDQNRFVASGYSSMGVLSVSAFPNGYITNTRLDIGPGSAPSLFDTTWTPWFYIETLNNGSSIRIDRDYGAGRGIYASQTTSGSLQLDIGNHYIQGALMPMFGGYAAGSTGGIVLDAHRWTDDTSPQSMISLQVNPASAPPFIIRDRDLAGNPVNVITGWQPTQLYEENSPGNQTFFPFLTGVFQDNTNFAKSALNTATAADNFNRANGTLTSPWVQSFNSVSISGNQIVGTAASVYNVAYYLAAFPNTSANPNIGGEFCDVTIASYGSGFGGCALFDSGGLQGAQANIPGFNCIANGTTLSIGTWSSTIASVSYTGAGNGDRIYFQGLTNAGANTQLSCTIFPTLLGSTPVTVTGSGGAVTTYGYPAVVLNGTSIIEDNFTGGTVNPIVRTTTENNWFSPQHFYSGTVGNPSLLASTLPTGYWSAATLQASAWVSANGLNSAYDGFNRANGSLGSNWTTIFGFTAPAITSNQVVGTVSGNQGAIYTASSFSSDQFAQITIPTGGNSTTSGVDVICRDTTPTTALNYYDFRFNNGNFTLFKELNNAFIALGGTPVAGTLNNNDILRIECIGFTITAYQITGGVKTQIAQATDTSITGGSPGFVTFGTAVQATIDNWSGGNVNTLTQPVTEYDWQQPQHVPALTVGTNIPIAGALPYGSIWSSLWAPNVGLCTDSTGKAVTTGCPAGGISGMTAGQVPIAGSATTITSSKPLQGTDGSVLSSGTVTGTAATLCTDANGGATTVGCTGGAISGMSTGQVAIAGSASSITSSKALQGTDSNILTSSTIAAGAGNLLCTDTGSGATTSGCAVFNTQSAATNTNIAATNMVASTSALHSYLFQWTISLTAVGVGCTSSTTINMNAIFTDPNVSTTTTELLGQITIAAGGNGTVGFVAQGTDNILAKSATAVQYSTSGYTAGTGCTTNPTYQVSPTLVQLW